MFKYTIPTELFQHIIGNKDLRKIFVIYLVLRSTIKFPAKRISSKEIDSIATSCKKSKRTIYNYLKIAQCYGMILQKNGHLHLIGESSFYKTIKTRYSKRSVLTFSFDLENPGLSLVDAQVTYFLKNQENALRAKLRSANGRDLSTEEYEDFLSHLQTREYAEALKFLPPVLTLESIRKMFGYQSKSSALYQKRKLISKSKIKVFHMKKPKLADLKDVTPAMLNPPHFARVI